MTAHDDRDLPRHESYALLSISRVHGSMNLFGSPIRPHHFVTLTIKEGRQYHGLGTTREMDGPDIVEIAMSEVQFAEAITTLNSGVGTPCTLIVARDGKALKRFDSPPPQSSELKLTRDEFRARVEERMSSMEAVKRNIDRFMEEGALSAKRRKEISAEIERFISLFTDSAPFFMERFEENAQKVVAQAKSEITAHAELTLRRTGIETLARADVPLLEIQS